MPENFSESKQMRDAIAAVAGPRSDFDNRESWLARAARRSGVTCRMIKALWYGEITDREHKAARRVLEAAERHGRKEANDLAGKFEIVANALSSRDTDFHSSDIAALLSAARALRGLDGAGTDGET